MEYNVITEADAQRAQLIVPAARAVPEREVGDEAELEQPAGAPDVAAGGPVAATEARAAGSALDRDDALDRLFKYIPSITVGTYLAIQGVVIQIADGDTRKWTLLIVSLVLVAGTYLFLRRRNVKRAEQLLASIGAFIVWVFALGGPFDAFWKGYEPWMGSVALFLGAFLLAAWKPPPIPDE